MPEVKGIAEFVDWILYHRQQVANGTAQLQYFIGANSAIPEIANVDAGQLPSPEEFLIHRIGVMWPGGTTAADHEALMFGSVSLSTNNKEYWRSQINMAPAGYGTYGMINSDAAAAPLLQAQLNNGHPAPVYGRWFTYPIHLQARRNFSARLEWNGGIVLGANVHVTVLLDGELKRAVQ